MKFLSTATLYFLLLVSCRAVESQPVSSPLTLPAPARHTLTQRLSEKFMTQLDAERKTLAEKVQPFESPFPLHRGTFHFHSHFSHDSVGTLDEIVAAAKATNTKIIGFTEHPSRAVDVVAENVKGWHEDIYFLAGTESSNQLHWPAHQQEPELRFLCHPEDIPTIDLTLYQGMEIYNTHSDVIDEPMNALLTAMLLNLSAVQKHPEAAFCSFLDYPESFLTRYDRLTRLTHLPGIAGNDSHQNQRLKLVAQPDGTVQAFDTSEDQVWQDKGLKAGLVMAALGQTKLPSKETTLADIQLDPYEISMRHVGTFLQLKDNSSVSEHAVRHALQTGRIIVGFELVAPLPSVGFWINHQGKPIGTVGDTIPWQVDLSLQVKLPLEAEIRIIRNGKPYRTTTASQLEINTLPDGIYRLEAFQHLADQRYPWVLSNPIYITDKPE